MARILVIEDAANLRLLYRMELEAEGYEIVDAGSGAEALEALNQEKIDVVVLDLLLPDCFGLQLLEEILSRHRYLPLVINTAYGQFRDNFQTWGAEAFVIKSSDLVELKNALAQAISSRTENVAQKKMSEKAPQHTIQKKNRCEKTPVITAGNLWGMKKLGTQHGPDQPVALQP
jgi:DNA-binding NtrC family response regulator